jgi:CBS domain-containing protein
MDTEIRVREAMTQDVVTVVPETTVDKAAKIMEEKNIGSVVVIEDRKPIGIVTERDISYRVVAKDKKPSKVKVREIMSTPIRTIRQNTSLTDASKIMAKYNLRRLPVVEGKSLVGIITNKDIVAIAPEQIEILKELSRMKEETLVKEVPEEGTCENCGDYGVKVFEVNGIFVCESCKEDMFGGE